MEILFNVLLLKLLKTYPWKSDMYLYGINEEQFWWATYLNFIFSYDKWY